jgi:hypothetical protein
MITGTSGTPAYAMLPLVVVCSDECSTVGLREPWSKDLLEYYRHLGETFLLADDLENYAGGSLNFL